MQNSILADAPPTIAGNACAGFDLLPDFDVFCLQNKTSFVTKLSPLLQLCWTTVLCDTMHKIQVGLYGTSICRGSV